MQLIRKNLGNLGGADVGMVVIGFGGGRDTRGAGVGGAAPYTHLCPLPLHKCERLGGTEHALTRALRPKLIRDYSVDGYCSDLSWRFV